MQNRIQRILDENQPRERAGFQGEFSTTEHLHALNPLIKVNEYHLKLCVGYNNITKKHLIRLNMQIYS